MYKFIPSLWSHYSLCTMSWLCRFIRNRLTFVIWILGMLGLMTISQIAQLQESANHSAGDFLYGFTFVNTSIHDRDVYESSFLNVSFGNGSGSFRLPMSNAKDNINDSLPGAVYNELPLVIQLSPLSTMSARLHNTTPANTPTMLPVTLRIGDVSTAVPLKLQNTVPLNLSKKIPANTTITSAPVTVSIKSKTSILASTRTTGVPPKIHTTSSAKMQTTAPLNRSTTLPPSPPKPPPTICFSYPVSRTSLCLGNSSDTFLLVIVHSDASHFHNREVIRTTWANEAWRRMQRADVLFIVGIPVNASVQNNIVNESVRFGDIIQHNSLDSYRNLTYKNLAGLKYISQFCQHLPDRYVLKTDDDIFVYLPPLVSYLRQQITCHPNITKTVFCDSFLRKEAIGRNPKGKWYVSWQDIPEKDNPPYCYGLGYVLSRDLVDGLLGTAGNVPFHWIDDVFVTGMTAKALGGVKHVQMPKESPVNGTTCAQPKCKQENQRWFVHTNQNTNRIKEIFLTVKDYGTNRDEISMKDCDKTSDSKKRKN